jgi:transcription antitermination factor NusB
MRESDTGIHGVGRRTRARELAMQALYQLDVQGDLSPGGLDDFFAENEADASVLRLAREWTAGAWSNVGRCDELIETAAIRWKVSRLSPVDRSILRLSAYQLAFCADIPPPAVINEGIELAKKFSARQSPGFVNGVLDAILRNLRSEAGERLGPRPGADS